VQNRIGRFDDDCSSQYRQPVWFLHDNQFGFRPGRGTIDGVYVKAGTEEDTGGKR